MTKKIKKIFTIAMICALLATATPFVFAKPNSNSSLDNTFSIMQISDTQFVARYFPQLFIDTTNWIVNQASQYNVKLVIHTGDIVDNLGNTAQPQLATSDPTQWDIANQSIGTLIGAGIPYCWDAGNHDQIPWNDPSGTWLGSSYAAFDGTQMRSKPYWVSDFDDSKNTAVKFDANGYHFLVINLEYMASPAAIDWMKGILGSNPDANVIVAAHSYLNKAGGYGFLGGNIDDRAWCSNLKTILDTYPNVFMTLSGHDPTGYAYSKASGNREEIFFNRQSYPTANPPAGGAAAVRIYTFNLATMHVETTTYSVYSQSWLTNTGSATANQFGFNVNLKLAVNPTDSFATGGGWILDNGNHANFEIVSQLKDGTLKGTLAYNYRVENSQWSINTKAWTGFYIPPDGSFAVLQGKTDIQKVDSAGQVVWIANDYQITVELVDSASDSLHLRVLDNNGELFWEAAGELQGGQIVIHL